MRKSGRLLLAAAVVGATMLTSLPANAFWGPFSFMRWGGWDGWGPGYGWGGYPGYGWGGYPGYGWGNPGYGYGYGWGNYGYPYGGYGGWGSPYGYGWGAPYAYPTLAVPVAPAAPATSAAK
jgi:hypothetical protein